MNIINKLNLFSSSSIKPSQPVLINYLEAKIKSVESKTLFKNDDFGEIEQKILTSKSAEFFQIRVQKDEWGYEINEEDLHQAKILLSFLKNEQKIQQIFSKIDFVTEQWDAKSSLKKSEQFNAKEANLILALIDNNELIDFGILSNLSSKVKKLADNFNYLENTKPGDLTFYKSTQHMRYWENVKGIKIDLLSKIESLFKRFIVNWKVDHAGVIHSSENGLKLGHCIPIQGYTHGAINPSKTLFITRHRFDIKPLIKTNLSDEKTKKLQEIFDQELDRLFKTEFEGIKYNIKNHRELFFKHKGSNKTALEEISVDNLLTKQLGHTDSYRHQGMCSEVVSLGLILAIQKVKREGIKEGIDVDFPFSEQEILHNLNPDRLFKILNQQKLLVKVESRFEKLFNI